MDGELTCGHLDRLPGNLRRTIEEFIWNEEEAFEERLAKLANDLGCPPEQIYQWFHEALDRLNDFLREDS